MVDYTGPRMSPVFVPEPLVRGEQVVELLDVSQARQKHEDGAVQPRKLWRFVWTECEKGRNVTEGRRQRVLKRAGSRVVPR